MKVKVTAGAGKNSVDGFSGGYLRVRVKAPAREGRANRELLRVLSDFLGLREEKLRIVEGHHKSLKTLLIDLNGEDIAFERLMDIGYTPPHDHENP